MATRKMVINYVPGDECRVAIVEAGKLEEFHAERMDGPSNHVGSIYVGKVANVEPGIQAAFVDFGLEHNGFLHTSDVHPQYFPGHDEDKTERVGRKTPRRERPPIQDCFRRGDEIAVQVLKEGVGTKGPTVTSYLSIPGRFLVMMPQMDKVGVSRKVEDEETRRKMRDILDQLDLPEGFGFILRTAGFDRTKAELKRDLAYLMRLWKDMERRWRSGAGKPRLLYSESDLLVRALRDMLTSEIEEIVVDDESALARAARFLKIVSPRTSTRLVHYTGKMPIYHAVGIESQIQMIHAREVPLPSGGRLVIDEAEALVAIDVNSGRMRDARDAEATAYKTNMEAADEICRQLRLRDIGGVVANDFIDMRQLKHRRELEARMKDNLKKDRARSTIGTVSEFGILEMTRQRMRASHESQHFASCPTCRGRGLVQKPDSVAVESLRDLAALVDHQQVSRIEMVVHPRIAGELLSTKRRTLSRVERSSGKHVDVRVSDAIAVDRVTFYAYDDRGADIDLANLRQHKPNDSVFQVYEIKADAADEWTSDEPSDTYEDAEPDTDFASIDAEPHPIEIEPTELAEYAEPVRPFTGRGGAHGHRPGQPQGQGQGQSQSQGQGQGQRPPQPHGYDDQYDAAGGERRGRRRRRGRRGRGGQGGGGGGGGAPGTQGYANDQQFPHAPGDLGDHHDHHDQHHQYPPQGDGQGNYDPGYEPQDGESFNQPNADAQYDGQQHAGQYEQGQYPQGQYPQGGYNPNVNGAFDPRTGGQPDQYGEQSAGGGEGGRRRRRRRRGRRGGGGGQGQGPGYAQGSADGQPFDASQQGGYSQGPYQGAHDGSNQGEYGGHAHQQFQEPFDQGENAGFAEGEYPSQQPAFDEQGYANDLYPEQGQPLDHDEPRNSAPPAEQRPALDDGTDSTEGQGIPRRRGRRRGGRGRGRSGHSENSGAPMPAPSDSFPQTPQHVDEPHFAQPEPPVVDVPADVEAQQASNEDPRPKRGGRGRSRGRSGRGSGDGGDGGARDARHSGVNKPSQRAPAASEQRQGPSSPKSQASSSSSGPAKAGAKPVRTLYGTVRRKLNPGDIKGRKREE